MAAEIIDGKKIADTIRKELEQEVKALKEKHNVVPGLAVVLVGENPASQVYVRMKNKACHDIGIYSEQHTLAAETSEAELLNLVNDLNRNEKIHGILVQLPLPDHIDEHKILNTILPEKDVDGFHPVNMGKLLIGEKGFKPCTPYGVQKMLVYAGVPIEGAHVVVVGRSNIVGKPVASILMQKQKDANATVTVCHSRTKDLGAVTRQADILIAAIGRAEMITADMVSEHAVVIDVGVNRVDAPSSKKGYKLVGDVKFDEVAQKCKAISPVPGGVGPMTITMLLYNTVESAKSAAGFE
ncbi:bifunctional methylenetetrahydrofolate dehydrogenase/methenyltetrahydrofolate cyclohydrolase FolD [candidate division KSB3 bacterium]|uniref:Bifunctional protein FolD n=1 Tax=candidate division KSB3 bacterium TaxID=2044937 RepID=A0A9D5JZ24_9BACT|nr:bifunctional methylenetetrahydrofolate dehydrogenase/methenyltetrahydrofolate cyclohydrolase FolD [candidate division KSB3 bacterium]MBD3326854.1 bifunctional methylenetetrahydrofolate dehydrogenase/methenyltetrahydrofolate cyclohydrolase FolD [candidate division KSB3 bacterium]